VGKDISQQSVGGAAEGSLAESDLKDTCLSVQVWSKSDAVVELVKEVAPHLMAGYIVISETEADVAKGMHAPLRLSQPEV
jgi:hypothetical protein